MSDSGRQIGEPRETQYAAATNPPARAGETGREVGELPDSEGHWTRYYDNDPASDAPAFWSIIVRRRTRQEGLLYSGWQSISWEFGRVDSLPKGGWTRAVPASELATLREQLAAAQARIAEMEAAKGVD